MSGIFFRKPPMPGLRIRHAELVSALREALRRSSFGSLDEVERSMYDRPPGSKRRGRRISALAGGAEFPTADQVRRLIRLLPASQRPEIERAFATAVEEQREALGAHETSTLVPGEPSLTEETVASYRRAMVACYRTLDLDALNPDTDYEQIPVLLRQVFIAQDVRADPPPVELPRDLRRRLLEGGDLDADELPADLDPATLAAARLTYQEQPARPVLDVVAAPSHRLTTILGDPGAGKSSLLRFIAVNLASADPDPTLSPDPPVMIRHR